MFQIGMIDFQPGLARLGEEHPPARDDRDEDRDVDDPDDATHERLRAGELDRPTMTRDADGGRQRPGGSAAVVTIARCRTSA